MKNKIVLIVGLIFIAALVNTFAAIKTIKFATEATYPPFEYVTPAGGIQGFDIDVAKALCKELKAQCTFTNQPFDSLIPSLKVGKFDAIIAAMAITSERQKEVDFTAAYYNNTVSFVAAKNSTLEISAAGLKGKTVGVQAGTTFEQYLQKKYAGNVKVNTYASEESAFLDLAAGRVDAVMGDTPLVEQWIKEHGMSQYQIIGKPVKDEMYFGKGDGIAIKKGNAELLSALNQALKAIKANGEYTKIKAHYFQE